MIPKKDASFHKLPSKIKTLYLTGMPRQYLFPTKITFSFKSEKTPGGLLTPQIQKTCFEQFKSVMPGEQQISIFSSNPTDNEAMLCACDILRTHYENGFKNFEFVSPSENIPFYSDKIKSLYIVMGGHTQDENTTHLIRKWARSPTGSAIWIILAGENPIDWTFGKLGVRPDFFFSVKSNGMSVG